MAVCDRDRGQRLVVALDLGERPADQVRAIYRELIAHGDAHRTLGLRSHGEPELDEASLALAERARSVDDLCESVERLGDGRFTCTGPMFKGFRMTLGPMALLRSRAAPGVRVALASKKVQAADQEMFRHLGVEPRAERILGLKSSVHFRADFQPIAKEILVVKSPGPALADPAEFKWTKLRKGVRLRPLGPAHAG